MNPICINLNCGGETAIQARGPHLHRVCLKCGLKQHEGWLSKTTAGVQPRSTQSTHAAIKSKLRAAILERAARRCEVCGRTDTLLHVGHFLSVQEGIDAGLTDAEINSEENLFCVCEECNLGQGKKPISIRLAVAIIRARTSCKQ